MTGRTEAVSAQIEARTAAAANALNTRMEQLAELIKTNAAQAEKSIGAVSGEAQRTLSQFNEQAEQTLGLFSDKAEKTLGHVTGEATRTLGQVSSEVERTLVSVSSGISTALKQNANEVERQLTAVSTGVSNVLKQNATDVERQLLGVSAEVARSFVGKADEISSQVSARANEMTRILDQNSSTLLAALSIKSKEFSVEVSKATDQAAKSIEAQGFTFARTMMDNSDQIARQINEASQVATTAVNSTLVTLQESTKTAIEQSKQTATTSVTEMLETHNMLRSDTTALFERLREANILLQEVLSGAHENMSSLENTLVTRVSEFVATMNEVAEKSGVASNQVDTHITSFHTVTTKVLGDLSQLAEQFETHGRGLAEAVALIDISNRKADETLSERRTSIETVVATLDERTGDIEQRLTRFASLLDESLEGASSRANDIARIIANSSTEGLQSLEDERRRTTEALESINSKTSDALRNMNASTTDTLRAMYDQHGSETHQMFSQTTQRFTDILQGMKQMASEMQRELEATRSELRRGILELPQETADSAAQMRRVIVDQIEALAELNRIVARHGRGIDAVEPARRPSPRWRRQQRVERRGETPRIEPAAPGSAADGSAEGAAADGPRSHGNAASDAGPAAARRHHRQPAAATPRGIAVTQPDPQPASGSALRRPRRRLAVGPVAPRLAAGGRRRASSGSRRGAPCPSQHRVARLAVGRHRADDRP